MRHGTIISLVLLVGLAAAGRLPGEHADNELSKLCSGQKVHLKTVEELAALVALADSGRSAGCSPLVIDALTEMKAITDDKKACTMQKAAAITGFVDKYLRNPSEQIPKALADFAVAYGMQVSGTCSHEMVDGFSREADARVYDKVGAANFTAYTDFKKYLLNESPVGMILEPIIKTGEVILPADLMQATPNVGAKLKLQLSDREVYARLQTICTNVLRPLYESTLLPLAHLIRAGFVNRAKLKGKKFKENGRFWSTAVFLCESLKLAEVEMRNTPEQIAIESEISETLSSIDGKELDSDLPDEPAEGAPVITAESAPVITAESGAEVGGKIVSSSVKSLVKEYNANKDEVERLRELIAARVIGMMRLMVKKAQYGSMLKDMLGMIKLEDEDKAAEFERAKQSLMRFIENPEREREALKRQVRERNRGADSDVRNELERKQAFWEGFDRREILEHVAGVLLLPVLVLWKFVGALVYIAFLVTAFVPYLISMLLGFAFNNPLAVDDAWKRVNEVIRTMCGWSIGFPIG